MASVPFTPAGFGVLHVPDASMTASALKVSGPRPFWYLISKGAFSRPMVFTLSNHARATEMTRALVRTCSLRAVRVASGSVVRVAQVPSRASTGACSSANLGCTLGVRAHGHRQCGPTPRQFSEVHCDAVAPLHRQGLSRRRRGDWPDPPQADMEPDENLDHPGGDAPRSTSLPKQWTIHGSGAG